MRGVLLAILLLTGPLAGCVGSDTVTVEEPSWPTGLLLTYEIATEEEDGREAFLVHNGTPEGTDLLAWNLSRPNLQSPLLTFDEDHQPRAPGWSDVFAFPIEDGDEHTARVGGANVTVTWTAVTNEGPVETGLEGVAETDDGQQVARFLFSGGDRPLLQAAKLDTPEGTNQSWQLVDARQHDGWNRPPSWEKGDWWTYNGTFRNERGSAQIVYASDETSDRTDQRVLSPVEVEDRVLMLPFQGWRDGDIAPQSGYVSGMMSTFWAWPLHDGKAWSGSTSAVEEGGEYQAASQIQQRVPLPDGTVTTTFAVEAYLPGEEEPFAAFTYSPRVEQMLDWRMSQAGADRPDLDFTLQDWGEAYHGEMEIPRRVQVEQIPQGPGSFLSGPAEIDRTFEVPEEANTVHIGSRSFAVHQPDVDPTFELSLSDPNGTVVLDRNASEFQDRRLNLAGTANAEPGSWRLTVEIGDGVSVLARLYANWFVTETVDFRSDESA